MGEKLEQITKYIISAPTPIQYRLDKWYRIQPFLIEKNKIDFIEWCKHALEQDNSLTIDVFIGTADSYIKKAADEFITPEDIKNLISGCNLNSKLNIQNNVSLNYNFNVVLSSIPSYLISSTIDNIKQNYGYDCKKQTENQIVIFTQILPFKEFISY